MGNIYIKADGSFGNKIVAECTRAFSAQDGGHADAVGRAIKLLAEKALPLAIQLDHALHDKNVIPRTPFGTGEGVKEVAS